MSFIADAVVEWIDEPEPGRYRASIVEYRRFPQPVLAADLEIDGWNRQHGIVEIEPATLGDLVRLGTGTDADLSIPTVDTDTRPPLVVAEAQSVDAPYETEDVPLIVPDELPTPGALRDLTAPELPEDGADLGASDPHSPRGRKLDRLAEQRAIHAAIRALALDDWTLDRDRQADRVGYDLEFSRAGRSLHVEVKGIQGPDLEFNLTAREWGRVLGDELFVVVAVTEVLDPLRLRVNLITLDRLAAAHRRVVQYRMSVDRT